MSINQCSMLESILNRNNMTQAYKRVKSNRGGCGPDGMTVDEILPSLRTNWSVIKSQILKGCYKVGPTKTVEIPKKNGGLRQLGVPNVIDRVIQQAISQALTKIYDKEFSEYSYGFRPKRNSHQALKQALAYINEGYTYVVDLDLERFFDKVNHDYLMNLLGKRIRDKNLLRLVGSYLRAGTLKQGLQKPRREGTPQGSPLSPTLSNILLDQLDRELERRGHKFVRYADDCSVYVKSRRAAERVQDSLTKFIEGKLKLKVNKEKSRIRKPQQLNLLGYSMYYKRRQSTYHLWLSEKTIQKFKQKVKDITIRRRSISLSDRLSQLYSKSLGWMEYFKMTSVKSQLKELDAWMRTRLRICLWKSWKTAQNRYKKLVLYGISKDKAYRWSHSSKGYCRISQSMVLCYSLTNKRLKQLGHTPLIDLHTRTRQL